MKAKAISVCVLALTMVGCSSIRPQLPKEVKVKIDAKDLFNYASNTQHNINYYREGVERLEKHEWRAGETNLAGGTVGAIGALAHSIPAAAGGAAIVGTSALVTRFYGTESQNDAYRKAYQNSKCLMLLANNLQPSGALTYVESPYGHLGTEQFVVDQLNQGSRRVFDTLFEELRKRAVSKEPDFDAFQTYMAGRLSSTPANLAKNVSFLEGQAVVDLKTDKDNKVSFTSTQYSAAEIERLAAAVGTLKADIGLCLTRQ